MALSLSTYSRWLQEIGQQPPWRRRADKEYDYYDGNQLNSEILQAQELLGIPSAIEPLIGPTIDAVVGMEVRFRRDFRVVPEIGGDDIATASRELLHKSERHSEADHACGEAYKSQVITGMGWVEVSRNPNPFEFPHRCIFVPRNEIWFDFLDRDPLLRKARYLVRRKWMDVEQAVLIHPVKEDLIRYAAKGHADIGLTAFLEGGDSTDLAMTLEDGRGWSIEESEWLDTLNQRVCLLECWYRVWEKVIMLQTPDGRVVEYDPQNIAHDVAITRGIARPQEITMAKARQSWWLGPNCLSDESTPYSHNYFPYVPFFGKREDRTGAPYGLARGMIYLQDEVNARISKMQWLLSAVRTEYTEGVTRLTPTELAQIIARPDAVIPLNASAMAQPGARFEVKRDLELNRQQYERLIDAREAIKRVGGIYNAFMGQEGQGESGVALNTLVGQSVQTLAGINDNYRTSRMHVGELLLSLNLQDLGSQLTEILVKGGVSRDDRTIILNEPTTDKTGIQVLNNDIQRARLKVELEDVPSTPTFRAQQLQVLREAIKAMPPQFQAITMPFMMQLMDLPNRDELMEAIKKSTQQITPEQVEQIVKEAVDKALLEAQVQLKTRELDLKERLINKDEVLKGVEATKTAMDAAAMVILNPDVAPAGDAIMEVAAGLNTQQPKMQGEQ